jgi:hypothetical protein
MKCRDCVRGVDHCHGTLVTHVADVAECTERCDDLDPTRHAWLITCGDVNGGCVCCTPSETVERSQPARLANVS